METMCAFTEPQPAGIPPNEGGVELVWPVEDQTAAGVMARRGVLVCEAGQVIARKKPVVAAVMPEGAGEKPAVAEERAVQIGEGVSWDEAFGAWVAQRRGQVRLTTRWLEVSETLEWGENLDAAQGEFDFSGDVILRRSVLDLAVLRGGRNIVIQDCIEAARVEAGGDITVQRGICGKEKGLVSAGGKVTARFLSNARIRAGGDVVVENEIDNSVVVCGGALQVERGTIMAGHMHAIAGIHCHTAGSPSGVRTILELGVTAEQQAEIRQATDASAVKRQKAKDIRTAVEPLMARQKLLTAVQKEKATELLYLAGEMETEVEALAKRLAELKRPLDAAMAGTIQVAKLLHAGVIIRYPNCQAVVKESLRGPLTVKVVQDAELQQPVIVAVDEGRGTKVVLPAVEQRGAGQQG